MNSFKLIENKPKCPLQQSY